MRGPGPGLSKTGRNLLNGLNERLCRERLGEIGDAAGFHRRHPRCMIVVASDVHDRQRNSRRNQSMPHLYSGITVQVDIEDVAEGLIELIAFLYTACRLNQNETKALLT